MRWSIHTRTAVAFGGLSMVLAAAVLVFVNLMTQRGIVTVLELDDGGACPRADVAGCGTSASPVWTVPEATASARAALPGAPPPEGHTGPSGSLAGVARVGQLVASQQWLWSAVGIGTAGLVAAGAGWLVARAVLRPIGVIRATAERISATTLHERIDLGGPDDEVRRLADTIDALFGRLEQAFEGQRRFVAQASHELRTPLALQRAAIQIGLEDDADPDTIRAVRQELLDANRRNEQLVEGLLDLAEAERGVTGRAQEVDLADVVEGAAAASRTRARSAGLDLHVQPGDGLRVAGDPVLVRHLVENLVDNALEYNRPDGFVRIEVTHDGLVVENSGPLVSPETARTLTEPFTRAEQQHAGRRHSGIGLSVVDAVVRAHGWRLAITPRSAGGLVVRVHGVSPV
ncbi:HAMP domain-containing sensor histidine kinase [Curtobacterium sp. MCBD17_019]|uniref:sensor histidine kinase n=1 Tax=Curtobacterium sp. MCBD17_019 TaxID=2175669 RepID=UPI000DA8EB64|nr:HAMP domain-containing sensor histidine kinase [Curtobacterium sp. MCBD17_019]PZE78286.1 two-component sensor histidine kinase [Curtobacterium sp. MCBD17_019]